MLRRLHQLLREQLRAEAPAQREAGLQLATAALLVETARADFDADTEELALIGALVSTHFGLDDATATDLLTRAGERADDAVSLYEFTRELNDQLSEAEKLRVLEMMWRVAHADGRIDKHEEHLLRRVADLLHLSHADFVRLRHATAE
jgi:uncharacterized tellurite resistance protein B-like protein